MKSYQFLKICKCFDKEREKTVNEKRKTEKVGLCFINGCFIKSVNMIIKGTLMQISKSPYMFVLI